MTAKQAIGVMFSLAFAAVAARAVAQTPVPTPSAQLAANDALKGRWVGEVPLCGTVTIVIASIAPDGSLSGSVDCPQQKMLVAIGDRSIDGQQLKGMLRGTGFSLEGMKTFTEVSFDGGRLSGFVIAPFAGRRPVSFARF